MKKLFYGVIVIAILVGGIFGFMGGKVFTDIPEDVLANLEIRYGENENFKFIDYIMDENTENSRVMRIKGKSGEFKLTRYYGGDGIIRYNDNYMGYKYEKEIKDLVYQSIRRVDSNFEFSINLDKSSFPDNTDSSMSLEKLLAYSETFIDVDVCSKPFWLDDDVATFSEKAKELGIKVNVSMLQGDIIKMYDFHNVMNSSESVDKKLFFSVGDVGEILYINRE